MKIRIGNDFVFNWAIERGGLPEDLSSVLEKHLHLSVFGKRVELVEGIDYDITGNVIRIDVTPTIANILGIYNAEFHYILPDNGLIDDDRKCEVDIDAFQIVAKTAQADDSTEFSMTSDMAIAFKGDKGDKGDSAYKVWLDAGNTGTEEDYFAYLRQPAVDAGASIAALELIIEGNESGRVTAEGERDAAETLRLSAESGRAVAEGLRDGAEVLRIAAEGVRDDNEGDRITAESDRADAEELRDSAELIRLQSEIGRNTAEGLRVNAETGRNTAEGLRASAETGRNTAEGTRVTQESARQANTATAISGANEAAGLADTARTELTTAVNTKLGEADGKISEMNTTLSTYDGRVTQVESDISQLEIDVKELELKDVVQSDKIKDIENVISTMNPNQSAQLSVSGRKVVSLPKNSANSGMSVKLEGLTEDVGGVITNFVPTGRVRSVGKNLLTGRYIDGSRIIEATGLLLTSELSSRTDYFRISANKQYILEDNYGHTGTADNRIAFYDANKTFISGFINAPNSHLVVTSPSNAVYARVSTLTARKDTLRLSAGASRIPYEPYRETSLYLTAPELRSNGTVKDEIRKGANGYELVKRISDIDGTVLATPVISPISYGGVLNSAENGTVYHEPIIADAGVYGTDIPIFNPDYPIASIEEIIKHEGGVDTYLNASTAVIAPDGLSFTHPDLTDGDLVLFTYAFDKESTNGNITATFYDSNVVKIDTVTGKVYRINEVVTNGVLTRALTEV